MTRFTLKWYVSGSTKIKSNLCRFMSESYV